MLKADGSIYRSMNIITHRPEAMLQVCGTQQNLRDAVHNHIHPEMSVRSDTPRW